MWLKRQVVMLPTNEKAIRPLIVNPSIGRNGKMEIPKHKYDYPAGEYQKAGYETFHLYFLCDEEIKEGDWFLLDGKSSPTNKYEFIQFNSKKIIATTDESLKYKAEQSGENAWYNPLPQPSQSFIEKFVEEYNKDNRIETVLVEYEQPFSNNSSVFDCLKINPKDNTISIRKVNKKGKHIIKFVEEFTKEFPETDLTYLKMRAETWIEQNL